MKLSTLRNKVKNRILRILSRFIWHNKKFRPAGVKNLSPDDHGSVEYLEINPPYDSTLQLAPEFIAVCSDYAKPILNVQFPGDFVVTLENGRIYSYDGSNMAVISSDNYLVEEISFQWSNDKLLTGKENTLFKQRIFTTPKKYKGKVFSLLAGGGAITYYYHWVFDSMPKIFLLKESGQFDQVDFFLVPNYVYKYQIEYLDYFGIDKSKVINGEVERHIQADSLVVCSYVRIEDHHPKWICDFLYRSFIPSYEPKKRDKLIYIGRGDAAVNRKVINESDLIEALKSLGFEIHFLSGISVAEQARLFNSAKVVVGTHGAGLSNLVFCEPRTKVLEIFPDNYVRHVFYDISNKKGLIYDYVLCASDGIAENSSDGQKISVMADVSAIKFKISSFLISVYLLVILF